MNKTIIGIFAGLLLGAGATYVVLQSDGKPAEPAAPATPDTTPAAPEAKPGTVHLEADEVAMAGIKTATPEAMNYKPETKGYARVLDPATLAGELADIESSSAALDASSKELARLQTLKASDNASAQSLEAAQATVTQDQSQLTAARAKLLSEWGPTFAGRADLPQLVSSLLARESALVRVDIPGGETLPPEPRDVRVTPIQGNAAPMPVELLGPAPMADAQAQGSSFLALLKQTPPPVDTMMVALMTGPGDGQAGFHLPGPAIIRYNGDTFVYVQTKAGDYERRRVTLGAELRDGSVFVTSGVTAQDNVVINGSAQLLSEELKSATGGPD